MLIISSFQQTCLTLNSLTISKEIKTSIWVKVALDEFLCTREAASLISNNYVSKFVFLTFDNSFAVG